MDELRNTTTVDNTGNELTMGERQSKSLAYIWAYEKWKIIVPVAALIVIIAVIIGIVLLNGGAECSVVLVNVQVDESFDAVHKGIDKYVQDAGLMGSGSSIEIRDGYRHYLKSDEVLAVKTDIVESSKKLSGELKGKDADIVIGNSRCVDDHAAEGELQDLRLFLPAEVFRAIGSENVYYSDVNGEMIPVGIRVARLYALEGVTFTEGDEYVLCFSAKRSDSDISIAVVKYLMKMH